MDLMIDFGYRVPDVVQRIREEVAMELHNLLALVAKEINISVVGIEFRDSPRRQVE